MSRYQANFQALRARREKAFIPFFVIGDPDYKSSLRAVKASLEAGADMLELGIAFSDPIADGPSIQAADLRALKAGMTVNRCFEFIKDIRKFSDVPIGLLVYYNLLLRRGVSRFCRQAGKAGVDGILAADVPIEEAGPVIEGCKSCGVDPIFMVTPTTTEERLRKILVHADGFLYLVDRKKDMIISGGVNVYPKDIEEIVVQHPAVRETAVFGVPHEKWGETPLAAVVLHQPGSVTPEELRDWINERVEAKFQRVSEVVLEENFPRNVAGKTLKREMREAYWEGRDIKL